MIKKILNCLKEMLAEKEINELNRYKILAMQYRQWLAEFPEVASALDNLHIQATGQDFHGKVYDTYLGINDLREKIRNESVKDIDTKGVYSSFISINSKIKAITLLLDNEGQFDDNEKNKLYKDLSNCIPFNVQLNLENVFNRGRFASYDFSSQQNKNLLLSMKMIEEVKVSETLTGYVCTKRGKDFIQSVRVVVTQHIRSRENYD
jgi:hypothetical protein